VSQAAQGGLARAVANRRALLWLQESREAIESSNAYVEKNGLPLAKHRMFRMARFDVYPHPDGNGYLLDVQADLLSHLNTRLVIPALPLRAAPKPARVLNPQLEIQRTSCSVVTPYMATILASVLKSRVINAAPRRDEIVAAIDLLLQGLCPA
jgi:toxin CcdB